MSGSASTVWSWPLTLSLNVCAAMCAFLPRTVRGAEVMPVGARWERVPSRAQGRPSPPLAVESGRGGRHTRMSKAAAGEGAWAPRIWLRIRHRPHRPEQLAHLAFADVAGDENDAAFAVDIGPGGELDWRMGDVLDELHHHRSLAARDIEKAFHAQ